MKKNWEKKKKDEEKEKETENEGKNCGIRVDGIVGMDYVLSVRHIKCYSLQLRDVTTTLPMFIADCEEFCPRYANLLIFMNAFESRVTLFQQCNTDH